MIYNRGGTYKFTMVVVDPHDITKTMEYYPKTHASAVLLDIKNQSLSLIDHIENRCYLSHLTVDEKKLFRPAEEGGLVRLNDKGYIPDEYLRPETIVTYPEYETTTEMLETNELKEPDYGCIIMVSDISADPRSGGTNKWGLYRYIGGDGKSIDSFQIIITESDMDWLADWDGLDEMFQHTIAEIDAAVLISHRHNKKELLDSFTEDEDGRLLYNGNRVSYRENFHAMIYTNDPNDRNIMAGDLAVYVTDSRESIQLPEVEVVTKIDIMRDNCDNYYTDRNDLIHGPKASMIAVTSGKEMFSGCTELLDIPWYDTRNMHYMNGMFKDTTKLTRLPSFFYMSAEEIDSLAENSGIVSIGDIASDTISSSSAVLKNAVNLVDVGVIKLDYSTTAAEFFKNCSSLRVIHTPISFDMAFSVESAFENCTSLIKVSGLNARQARNAKKLFKNCPNLVFVGDLDLSAVTDTSDIFAGCTKLHRVYFKNGGLNASISFVGTDIDDISITALADMLPTKAGQYIDITGTPAASKITPDVVTTITSKGWELRY